MPSENFTDPTPFAAHRPWPLPTRPWLMTQRWSDLLFMHWPVALEALRPLVPRALVLDQYEGTGWVSLASFWLSHLRLRGAPRLPWTSSFLELNVRTYVTLDSRPGVYFFSLDAASVAAVLGARTLFDLPYFLAEMRGDRQADGSTDYVSRRRYGRDARFHATYAPDGPVAPAESGSLDYFLAERYCLYTADARGRAYRTEIHHVPWPLQPARGILHANTMTAAAGITLPDVTPRLAFARSIDVVVWSRDAVIFQPDA